MSKRNKWLTMGVIVVAALLVVGFFLNRSNLEVLNPKGVIAYRERSLIITASLLSLIVVLPVFVLTFFIAWKYRAGNKHAKYRPELDHNAAAEIAWWTIPSVIIFALSVLTWNASHSLDPYKTITAEGKTPLNIQVVALNWKWLFIYPDQHIASINMVVVPVNTPLNFEITSDAAMNSFWIPQLGGQIYAMPGMLTNLHLMASQAGDYHGSSANISGDGFAGMGFMARSTSMTSFNHWAKQVVSSKSKLDMNSYKKLAMPSQYNPVSLYALTDNQVFNYAINKYLTPPGQSMSGNMSMPGMMQ